MSFRKASIIVLSVFAVLMMASCALAPIADAEKDTGNEQLIVINYEDFGPGIKKTWGDHSWDGEKAELTLGNDPIKNVFIDSGHTLKIIVNGDVVFKNGNKGYPGIYCQVNDSNAENERIQTVTIEGKGSINITGYAAGIDATLINDLVLKDLRIVAKQFDVRGIKGHSITIDKASILLSSDKKTDEDKDPLYYETVKKKRNADNEGGIYCDNMPEDQIICYNADNKIIPWKNDGSVKNIMPKEPGKPIEINPLPNNGIVMKIVVIAAIIVAIVAFLYALYGPSKKTS